MPKKKDKGRTEIHLTHEKMNDLKALANKGNRSIKNYAETVILTHIEQEKTNESVTQ